MEANYKRTVAGSVGAGVAAVFNASGRQYYILEHKTESVYHHVGESQKIIVDQVELGRDSACQVRFDESFETVSRRHAAIVKDGENWKIIPLSQTNATLVNGQPVQGERILSSGDEIRLSSKGPIMGFIIPQGKQSLVSSIGMTERLNLFRQQALQPYKRALWIMAAVLVLAVGGLIGWNVYQANKFEAEMAAKQNQINQVQESLEVSDELIQTLNAELEAAKEQTAAERALIQKKLKDAQAERDALIEQAAALRTELQATVDEAGKASEAVQSKLDGLEQQMEAEAQKKIEAAKAAEEAVKAAEKEKESSLNSIINRNKQDKPKLKKF